MAALVMVANKFWKSPSDLRGGEVVRQYQANQLTAEDIAFLNRHIESCENAVRILAQSSQPEAISPLIINAPEALKDIGSFYPLNPGVQMFEPRLEREAVSMLRLPEGNAIEGRWRSQDGRLIEAVFMEKDDEVWVDWHHFVRFSEYPWSLFLAGNGPDQAEFRLLARQRLTRMALDDGVLRPMSVEFFSPRFGQTSDIGSASPPFDLSRNSEAAAMLSAGFAQAKAGRMPFGSLLPPMESDAETIRVRVVVRRIEEEESRRFEIVEVRACHWLQHDDAGILKPLN